MNLFNARNIKILEVSIFILNILFFAIFFLSSPSFILSIKISILVIVILIYSILFIKKQNLITYPIDDDFISSDRYNLYKQHSNLMAKFLKFKDLEVHNLTSEISIKDKLYKQLFDFAPDAFVIYNRDAIIYSNDAFMTLVDANDDGDFFSKGAWDFIHPTSMATAKLAYDNLLGKVTDTNIINIQVVSLNNVTKRVRVSSSIVFFEDAYYIFSCIHDLSTHDEQERIKMELKNNIANERYKVEFFANISHDIKTPVNVIYSAVQLQDMYALSNDYDKILVYNNIIKQNCLRLQKLLNDILDITKIDANHFKPKLELCNIICSIEYITQSITSYIEHNDISIIFDTNVEDKFVMTDLNLIERIMLNLISNAIKYGKQGGNVWVTLHDEGNHLIIRVEDDGIGIPKTQISNIFKRFHKAHQNTTSTVSSNGIGLSLVKSMVKTLDGIIFCLSTEGVGSEFVVILPMESLKPEENAYCEYATSLDLSNNLNIELSDI